MINGAVAQEAFDKAQYEADMIDHEWEAGSGWDSEGSENLLKYRSSRWYELFGNKYMLGNDDFRSKLFWKDRFGGVHDIVNVYSETDEVVGNPTGWLDFDLDSVWVLQERLKGTAKIYGTRPLGIFGQWLACEGGWGVNSYYAFDIRYYLRFGGFLRPAGSLSRDEVVLHPLFTPFDNEPEKMHSLAWFPFVEGSTEQYALRGLFLGDAIVAESHSMGANSLDSVDNIPMHGQMANKGTWPHTNSSIANLWLKDSPLWYHADIKNLAYFYVYKVFDKMTNEME